MLAIAASRVRCRSGRSFICIAHLAQILHQRLSIDFTKTKIGHCHAVVFLEQCCCNGIFRGQDFVRRLYEP